ncbi:MAG: DNA-directed RNA polymerase subunit alpha [Oscillospiraceae bacterium]|jgi:DNA-directed RNA polymerase subunit alpha|nr:DNA-directed RNA polymerase subunit alpha [Oscillospiraceae bacterium]
MLERMAKPALELELSSDGRHGVFQFAPLENGFGNTIGNGLRRVLLSSLPGCAATYFRIEGVAHEFATVPGVKEDVSEIILNIKSIIAKLTGDDSKLVYIKASGGEKGKTVTAKDIICDSELEILNGDLVLATLSPNASFNMDILFECGRGYDSREKNVEIYKNKGLPIGTIFVDSIYTPVVKVNYTVENMLFRQRADYDKLTLEVMTDGSVDAKEAVAAASGLLCDLFAMFSGSEEPDNLSQEMLVSVETKSKDKLYEMTIEELDLSVRAYNCLKRAGLNSIEDLCRKSENEMRRMRNLGNKSYEEVVAKLRALGLYLTNE